MLCSQRGEIGSGLENKNEAAGCNGGSEQDDVRCQVFHTQEQSCFQKKILVCRTMK